MVDSHNTARVDAEKRAVEAELNTATTEKEAEAQITAAKEKAAQIEKESGQLRRN